MELSTEIQRRPVPQQDRFALTLNGGSSSLKFAIFELDDKTRRVAGKFDRMGREGTTFEVEGTNPNRTEDVSARSHAVAPDVLFAWIDLEPGPG